MRKGINGNFHRPFKGMCRYCGKYGHKAIECKSHLQDEARGQQNSRSNTKRHYDKKKIRTLLESSLIVERSGFENWNRRRRKPITLERQTKK